MQRVDLRARHLKLVVQSIELHHKYKVHPVL